MAGSRRGRGGRVPEYSMSESSKATIRSGIRARLSGWDPAARRDASVKLTRRLWELDEWKRARSVLLYAPLKDEPDLWPLVTMALSEGRQVALPVFVAAASAYGARRIQDPERDLVAGRFGVREPGPGCGEVALATLDLVVVPGLAFTQAGWRLGRGGGFYDRLLNATSAVRCGVGRDEQLLAYLPSEPHDAQLDIVLTPSAMHRCPRSAL